jgi:ADP-heptose:LPS heptosyltransferase
MIPVLFPQPVAIGSREGGQCRFAGYDPALPRAGAVDAARVYLLQEELAQSIAKECRRHGLGEPVALAAGIIENFSSLPATLPQLLAEAHRFADQAEIRICLINGGGGGFGDGILFAPALAVLRGRISELLHANQRIDIFSMMPERTAPVVSHLPGVRVLPMELSLAQLGTYHAFHDFSGMLRDKRFAAMHMTDFYLDCMGINPDTVPAGDKQPFLPFPGRVAEGIDPACDALRVRHGGRPLAAFIFTSAYTRNMPPALAAQVINALWQAGWLPVVLMADAGLAARFVAEYGLAARSADLSALSTDFSRYVGLLSRMDAIVSVDTSAVHVGAALGKPTVGLFNSIDMATRIAYSPTVEGVQVRYQGKSCVAPCGLSKARAYISGTLYDGRPVTFERGYACDEAVDREAILGRATARLKALAAAANPDQELAAIWREATEALHGALSPCWHNLQPAEVVAALGRVRQRTPHQQGMAAPRTGPSPRNRGE